jgi:hypothetical protein
VTPHEHGKVTTPRMVNHMEYTIYAIYFHVY